MCGALLFCSPVCLFSAFRRRQHRSFATNESTLRNKVGTMRKIGSEFMRGHFGADASRMSR